MIGIPLIWSDYQNHHIIYLPVCKLRRPLEICGLALEYIFTILDVCLSRERLNYSLDAFVNRPTNNCPMEFPLIFKTSET